MTAPRDAADTTAARPFFVAEGTTGVARCTHRPPERLTGYCSSTAVICYDEPTALLLAEVLNDAWEVRRGAAYTD